MILWICFGVLYCHTLFMEGTSGFGSVSSTYGKEACWTGISNLSEAEVMQPRGPCGLMALATRVSPFSSSCDTPRTGQLLSRRFGEARLTPRLYEEGGTSGGTCLHRCPLCTGLLLPCYMLVGTPEAFSLRLWGYQGAVGSHLVLVSMPGKEAMEDV